MSFQIIREALETSANFISNFSSKRNYYQFIKNFSEISERHFARTACQRSRINHCEEETQSDCSVEIL
jgi:hypothetical protein